MGIWVDYTQWLYASLCDVPAKKNWILYRVSTFFCIGCSNSGSWIKLRDIHPGRWRALLLNAKGVVWQHTRRPSGSESLLTLSLYSIKFSDSIRSTASQRWPTLQRCANPTHPAMKLSSGLHDTICSPSPAAHLGAFYLFRDRYRRRLMAPLKPQTKVHLTLFEMF